MYFKGGFHPFPPGEGALIVGVTGRRK